MNMKIIKIINKQNENNKNENQNQNENKQNENQKENKSEFNKFDEKVNKIIKTNFTNLKKKLLEVSANLDNQIKDYLKIKFGNEIKKEDFDNFFNYIENLKTKKDNFLITQKNLKIFVIKLIIFY